MTPSYLLILLLFPPLPARYMGGAPSSAATLVDGAAKTILGKYVLGHLLGRGGFAHVYYGQSIKDNSSVAIKIFDKSKTNAASATLILREVAIMRRLNHHPNILRIHELLATKTKIYLVMELAHGGDLYTKLACRPGHRLPYVAALRLFHQLVSALHFCHHHGVTHRDLKPQNILLDKAGDVKLSDFGLSTFAGEGSTAPSDLLKTACGTPAFMAPEVMKRSGAGYDGGKADAWSCGIILYAMLFGALPFFAKNLEVMRLKMLSRQYRFPSDCLVRPVMDLIHRLLDPDPVTRLSIREIANDPWFTSSGFGHGNLPLGDVMSAMGRDTGFGNVFKLSAFDMVWACHGLDLSGEFGRKRRFMVEDSAGRTVERAVEVGRELGYEVESQKGGNKVWMRRATVLLVVEVLEVASKSLMVDVEVVEGCRGVACMANGSGGDNRIEEVLKLYAS